MRSGYVSLKSACRSPSIFFFIIYICCCCPLTKLCLFRSPMDCSPPDCFVYGTVPGKNTGVGCHFLLQGVFLTQGSNPPLLAGRFFTTVSPFVIVQSLSYLWLFVTPWTAACQASLFLSFTLSWSLLKHMSIELMMPSNHLILCWPLLLPSIFPSIRVFSNESGLHIRWPKVLEF